MNPARAGTRSRGAAAGRRPRPDGVTVGVSLPDRDGLELVWELRDRDDRQGFGSPSEHDVLLLALDTGCLRVRSWPRPTSRGSDKLGATQPGAGQRQCRLVAVATGNVTNAGSPGASIPVRIG